MNVPTQPEEILASQLLEDEPSHNWSLDRLEEASVVAYAALVGDERSVTARYWSLGKLLHLTRKHFTHGQWGGYLKRLKIDKTRAAKAMRIFATFSTAEQTAGLTVAEAYAQRVRRPRKKAAAANATVEAGAPSPSPTSPCRPWPQFVELLAAEIERQRDEIEFATSAEASKALTDVVQMAELLRGLEARLRAVATQADAEGNG